MDEKLLKVGDVVSINGQPMRYVGDGRFEPVGEPLAKRFDPSNEGPLVRRRINGET
jgi:hypothetical protein